MYVGLAGAHSLNTVIQICTGVLTFYATDFAALAQIPILTSFVLNKLDRVWPGQAMAPR